MRNGSGSAVAVQRRERLARRFQHVRAATRALCADLSPEDAVVQSMPEASPAKWHLAHTSWFFETFVLAPGLPGYAEFHPRFGYLFNSYYDAIGERHARPQRGLLTRPGLGEVLCYRDHVDGGVRTWLERAREEDPRLDVFELGLNHEEQHQELVLTDVKHLFALNPLEPVYRERPPEPSRGQARPLGFVRYEAGLRTIGHAGGGFAFDNEGPAHRVHVEAFELADRPVTNGEFLEFVAAGGYREPRWWLSDGADWVRAERVEAPWTWRDEGGWTSFTLAGRRALDPAEPVTHLSYYEADAYARFRGARLPREEEWEIAARDVPVAGNFVEEGRLHPRPVQRGDTRAPAALFGDVWEWTQSPYVAYPGYRAAEGALGEYNGKFMANQMVLRGGSCASPAAHLRSTYRNFFHPTARWQFSGVRLARDA